MLRNKNLPTKGAPEAVRESNVQMTIYGSARQGTCALRGRLPVSGWNSCKSRSFADYDEAKLEAESVAIAIHNGSLDSLELIGEKRRAHERAAAIVAELDRPLDTS